MLKVAQISYFIISFYYSKATGKLFVHLFSKLVLFIFPCMILQQMPEILEAFQKDKMLYIYTYSSRDSMLFVYTFKIQ